LFLSTWARNTIEKLTNGSKTPNLEQFKRRQQGWTIVVQRVTVTWKINLLAQAKFLVSLTTAPLWPGAAYWSLAFERRGDTFSAVREAAFI
jgi:hypothetical protein